MGSKSFLTPDLIRIKAMKNPDRLIHLGSCSRPHGIKGGFSAQLLNSKDSTLKKGSTVVLKPVNSNSSLPAEGASHTINNISFGNKCIVYFEGVADRSLVESMVPFDLFVSRDSLPEPEEGEVYLEDLVGLRVVNEDGRQVGRVKDYFDNGAQTVLVVKKANDVVMELPFVEEFFPRLNLEEGTIQMVEPEII